MILRESLKPVVVIATYNEASSICDLLDQLLDFQVIVVDDDSPDGTSELIMEYPNVELVRRYHERGIASAYELALRLALEYQPHPRYILQMDAGGTHDPSLIEPMLHYAAHYDVDLVIGSRFLKSGISPFQHPRTLISQCAAFLVRKGLGIFITDATSGFRLWRRDLLELVLKQGAPAASGFAFQLEYLYRAFKCYGIIAEFRIPYRLTNSSFKLSMLREALIIYGGLLYDHFLHNSSRR